MNSPIYPIYHDPADPTPALTVIVHVVCSESPLHVPTPYRFDRSGDARMFAEAVRRASGVIRVYATNVAGARLVGFDYLGTNRHRRLELPVPRS